MYYNLYDTTMFKSSDVIEDLREEIRCLSAKIKEYEETIENLKKRDDERTAISIQSSSLKFKLQQKNQEIQVLKEEIEQYKGAFSISKEYLVLISVKIHDLQTPRDWEGESDVVKDKTRPENASKFKLQFSELSSFVNSCIEKLSMNMVAPNMPSCSMPIKPMYHDILQLVVPDELIFAEHHSKDAKSAHQTSRNTVTGHAGHHRLFVTSERCIEIIWPLLQICDILCEIKSSAELLQLQLQAQQSREQFFSSRLHSFTALLAHSCCILTEIEEITVVCGGCQSWNFAVSHLESEMLQLIDGVLIKMNDVSDRASQNALLFNRVAAWENRLSSEARSLRNQAFETAKIAVFDLSLAQGMLDDLTKRQICIAQDKNQVCSTGLREIISELKQICCEFHHHASSSILSYAELELPRIDQAHCCKVEGKEQPKSEDCVIFCVDELDTLHSHFLQVHAEILTLKACLSMERDRCAIALRSILGELFESESVIACFMETKDDQTTSIYNQPEPLDRSYKGVDLRLSSEFSPNPQLTHPEQAGTDTDMVADVSVLHRRDACETMACAVSVWLDNSPFDHRMSHANQPDILWQQMQLEISATMHIPQCTVRLIHFDADTGVLEIGFMPVERCTSAVSIACKFVMDVFDCKSLLKQSEVCCRLRNAHISGPMSCEIMGRFSFLCGQCRSFKAEAEDLKAKLEAWEAQHHIEQTSAAGYLMAMCQELREAESDRTNLEEALLQAECTGAKFAIQCQKSRNSLDLAKDVTDVCQHQLNFLKRVLQRKETEIARSHHSIMSLQTELIRFQSLLKACAQQADTIADEVREAGFAMHEVVAELNKVAPSTRAAQNLPFVATCKLTIPYELLGYSRAHADHIVSKLHSDICSGLGVAPHNVIIISFSFDEGSATILFIPSTPGDQTSAEHLCRAFTSSVVAGGNRLRSSGLCSYVREAKAEGPVACSAAEALRQLAQAVGIGKQESRRRLDAAESSRRELASKQLCMTSLLQLVRYDVQEMMEEMRQASAVR